MMIGFNAPPTADVLEDTAENQLTNLISFAGLMVLFMLDFHHVILSSIVDSYKVMPLGVGFDPQGVLITLTNALETTFYIMLRLASPFIIYGLLFNVAIGMVNKLAPQMPLYFISLPYLIMGGMFLLYLGIAAMLRLFADGFGPMMQGS
jgi:flagellar biosynthesis protein FliR